MDKFAGDMYLELNQPDTTIDELNLNAIWVDLDKGLLSENIGLQCESIVKLTELFDKFQLPVFVNSGFLRLARVFQNGNNYIKLQVIRVIEKNKKHLGKVLNVDEISKLIFYNIHSNDALCRSLTLKALGGISSIINDKYNVQHSIRLALESHDELEAKEAIFAADKFCSVSKSFASSLFDRICEIIEDIQSPIDRKLKLIPLFVHMHHDPILSAKAKNICKSMFYSFPRADISRIILNVLTKLACKSFTNIHETITFFLELLHEESREKIHIALLNNLNLLAKKVSHLWSQDNLSSFIEYVDYQKQNDLLLLRSSEILYLLAKNSNIYFLYSFNTCLSSQYNNIRSNTIFKNLIETMMFHNNHKIAFTFCLLTTTLLLLHKKQYIICNINNNDLTQSNFENVEKLLELTRKGLFSIILYLDESIGKLLNYLNVKCQDTSKLIENLSASLKNSLKCTIDLIQMNDQVYINELDNFISSNLLNSIECSQKANYYCETLLALTKFDRMNKSIILSYGKNENPNLCKNKKENNQQQKFIAQVLSKLIEKDKENKELRNNFDLSLQLKLINLLLELQARKSVYLDKYTIQYEDELEYCSVSKSINSFVEINRDSLWQIFKISRMCVRYSHYDLAYSLYRMMKKCLQENSFNNISTYDLNFTNWFEFMSLLCKAENLLSLNAIKSTNNISELIIKLNQSLSLYLKAQSLFKSSCSRCIAQNINVPILELYNSYFQIRYCELRSECIKLYLHLILSSMAYQTIPAPVFQLKSSENIDKLGKFGQSLKYIVNELQKLSIKYKEFTSECFDADDHTINILNITKRQIECLIFCINILISTKSEQAILEEFCSTFLINYKSLEVHDNELKQYTVEMKISESFFSKIYGKIKGLLNNEKSNTSQKIRVSQFQEILLDFISFPISLPRAFFSTLQKTQIKLIVNPNTKKSNSLHIIRNDQSLVIKIDGIISQQLKLNKPIRTIKKVQISMSIDLDTKATYDHKYIPIKFSDVKTSTELPKNDYFSSNFLINLPYCGIYTIQVDLFILDNNDIVWRYITERHQIQVKVEEDPNRQKLFAAIIQHQTFPASNSNSTYQTQNQQRVAPFENHDTDGFITEG